MIDKYFIIIDDQDQSSKLRTLERKLRENEGIRLIYKQVNPSDGKFSSYDELLDTSKPDVSKILDEIVNIPFFRFADSIAIDYNLIKDYINGFELALSIRDNGYNKKEEDDYLDSAGIEDAIKSIIEVKGSREKINMIKKLTDSNLNFATRGDEFSDIVIEHLKQTPQFDFEDQILKWMDKYKNSYSTGIAPFFQGLKMEDIANEIRQNSGKGQEYKRNLIELLFSIIIQINELE